MIFEDFKSSKYLTHMDCYQFFYTYFDDFKEENLKQIINCGEFLPILVILKSHRN